MAYSLGTRTRNAMHQSPSLPVLPPLAPMPALPVHPSSPTVTARPSSIQVPPPDMAPIPMQGPPTTLGTISVATPQRQPAVPTAAPSIASPMATTSPTSPTNTTAVPAVPLPAVRVPSPARAAPPAAASLPTVRVSSPARAASPTSQVPPAAAVVIPARSPVRSLPPPGAAMSVVRSPPRQAPLASGMSSALPQVSQSLPQVPAVEPAPLSQQVPMAVATSQQSALPPIPVVAPQQVPSQGSQLPLPSLPVVAPVPVATAVPAVASASTLPPVVVEAPPLPAIPRSVARTAAASLPAVSNGLPSSSVVRPAVTSAVTAAPVGASAGATPRRTPSRIAVRVDVPSTSRVTPPPPQPLAMPQLPTVPMVAVRPIGLIQPASPPPRPEPAALAGAAPTPVAPAGGMVALDPNSVAAAGVPVRPTRPNYQAMSAQQQQAMHTEFRTKFGILRQSFPTWNVTDPPEGTTLDQKHDLYESYVRQIIVSLNCNQWKVYLVIMFLGIEVLCIKGLGLDARGYTMSQVRIMNRYDQVLVELGEKYYVQGPSTWPVEARIIMMAAFQGIIFLVVRYLSKSLGGDSMSNTIQDMINGLLSGGLNVNATPTRDQNGIPVIPGLAAGSAAAAGAAAPMGGDNPMAGLQALLGQFAGAAGGVNGQVDMTSMIANIGNAFTGVLHNNQNAPAGRAAPGAARPAPARPAAAGAPRPAQQAPRRAPRFQE